ncbi:hypothetical protein [uncultured Brevibacillus sp.]|uniref:hypothetical protein n=1 Tax=uncultured Brevibacillus sp. TaxID=169970 RepID=UPI0025998958|nr:hypothetical protein [uncultured Brevibacillus sp.]
MKANTKWAKPKAIAALTSVLLLSVIYFTYETLSENNSQDFYDLSQIEIVMPISKVEYIRFDHNDGSYEEHWRDIQKKQDRHDSYSKYGVLMNRLIVVNSGKTVISIGNEGGKWEAYTWELSSKDAEENNEILQKSLINEVKEQMNDKKWTLSKNSKMIKNDSVDEVESVKSGRKEIVQLDTVTGVPLKREVFEIISGKEEKVLTETYQFIEGSTYLFEANVHAKEVPADDIVVTKEDV